MTAVDVQRTAREDRARRSTRSGAFVAIGLASLLLVIAAPARSESPSQPTTKPALVRIHWVDGDQKLFGEGSALGIVADSLRFDRIRVRDPRGYWRDAGPVRVHVPSLDRIEMKRGRRGHALIGAVIGTVVGFIGTNVTVGFSDSDGPRRDAGWAIAGSALLGAGIGALIRTDKWERVNSDELRAALQAGTAAIPDVE